MRCRLALAGVAQLEQAREIQHAAAVVRDAMVSAQEVGSIAQQTELVAVGRRCLFVPEVAEIFHDAAFLLPK
jgi:hypothetical protein